jgi:tRNA (cytidine32/guanosine34-2'-O)-methyltransferase
LRHTTTLQADLTTPSTIPLVLSHLGHTKADLVICDGAPDVTGVHDLDAYLHHQLLMAAFTLTIAILAKGGTAVYKVFLSPLDPKGERLREGFKVFFREEGDKREWFEEFDDEAEGAEGPGVDSMGRRGGVWIRKPRSSRKGSGGEL